MTYKKHVCITGMDGSGKSTLIRKLTGFHPSVHVSNIWDLLERPESRLPFRSKKDIDRFLCDLTPDSRLLFLAHAMKYSIDVALQSEKETVISDSYYYKYFATEMALGADQDLIMSLMAAFPEPDIVIELELPIEESVKRKNRFSRYECGLANDPGKWTFLEFQGRVGQEWKIFPKYNWKTVSSDRSSNDTFEEVIKILEAV